MRWRARQVITTLVAVAVPALLVVEGAWAQGILNTKHNLSSSSTQAVRVTGTTPTTGTNEVCVFCHTPHGADTAVAAPLWNRAVNTTTNAYTMYTSPTFDSGSTVTQPLGVSLACLSCHDGTIALDALRNRPGSGGYDPAAPSAGWTWVGTGTGNTMPAGGITNIGTDLRNDHPISMLYSAALGPSSASGTNDHATGFNDPTGPSESFTNGVRLYSGRVECASCHDPHRADTQTFLRTNNDGSALCLTCHRKNVGT